VADPASAPLLVAALLRALSIGHRSHRAGLLRLLAGFDDAVLLAEPAFAGLAALLRGDDAALALGVGELVSSRGLTPYAPLLLELLRRDDRREEAERWLRRAPYPRPTAMLVRLAVDPKADLRARAAALRLLEQAPLAEKEHALLVATLAHGALHGPALRLLEPVATESLVVAAAATNLAYGRALVRKRREERTGSPEPSWFQALLSRLSPDHDALGVDRRFRAEQRDFVHGIARLAVAAHSQRYLERLLPYAFDPGFAPLLERAWVEQGIDTIAGELLAWLGRPFSRSEGWTTRRRAIALRLLGQLATAEAIPTVERHLPAVGSLADQDGQAAIVALARLRARTRQGALQPKAQLSLLLDGALAFVRRALGQPPGGAPGHASTVAACFEAGAALADERFARAALDVLAGARDVPEVGDALAPALARLAPLELEPALERVLGAPDARSSARAAAVDVVERTRLVRLAPALVEAARRDATVADRAARALRPLLGPGPDVARHVEALAAAPGVTDEALDALLERACAPEVLAPDAARALGRAVLLAGGGGTRTRARALALVRAEPDPRALLELTVRLLSSPHGDVRTVALELSFELGVVAAARAGDADPTLEPAWRALPKLVAQALASHDRARWARKQTSCVLDLLLPRAGLPGLTREAAEELRQRLRQAGAWTSVTTFHAAHRRLLELAAAGVDVGLLHGGLLELLGSAALDAAGARHASPLGVAERAKRAEATPKTAAPGTYEGPLPRLAETRRSASPFVQEALWDLVATPAYKRTLRLTLSFLASPRPRVRAGALGVVPRDGALAHEGEVLARLDDADTRVREAAVEVLSRHELARFAPALRPRLADPSDRVKLAAARALARWGDRGGLELVATFLGSDDDALRREAVAHLRRFEPTDLRGLLAPYVALERPRAAAAALAALRPDRGVPEDPALHAAVFALAARGKGPLRAAALAWLPQVTDAPRLAEVVPLLADADPTVRAAAGQVLRRLDGRPHAAAIARLAAESADGQVRRELLGLLVDQDVPEATRGLVPLLLDLDPQVRRAALSLASGLRGPSLRPDLEALLRRGLDVAAPPEALRDLVILLDRTGGDDATPALVDALRCEERGVWEAVLEAARAHGSNAHGGKLVELLKAKRPLAPPLLTLALGEAARLHRTDLAADVARTAREHPNETVRRKALEVVAVLDRGAAGTLALEEAKAAERRLAALEKRPEARDAKRTKALRLERARIVGTARSAARLAFRLAPPSLRAVDEVLRALPDVALQATVPGAALDAVARGDDVHFVEHGALAELKQDRWERIAWRVRDRLEPSAWVEGYAQLLGTHKTNQAFEPALLLARARAGEPLDVKLLVARVKQAGDQPQPGQRAEDLAVGLASVWQPGRLPEVLEPLVAGAVARAKAPPADRWGGKARNVAIALEHWATKKLWLGARGGTPSLVELAPELPQDSNGDGLARLHAAEGDLERLLAELARRPEKDRLRLLPLVGEVGGPAAIKALSTLGGADATVSFREGAAKALALTATTGGPPAGAEALASRLLQDADPGVLVAALQAVERLGLGDHADVVVRLLGHSSPAVQKAAADAAGALRLARARDPLLALVRGAPASEGAALLSGAALVLEDAGAQKIAVIKTVRELCGLGLAEAKHLVETPGSVLQAGLTQHDAEQKRLHLMSVGARVVLRHGAQASAGSGADGVRDAAARALEALPQAVLVEGEPTALVEALRGRRTDRLVERLAHVLERVVGGERLDTVVGALLGEAADGPQVAGLRVLGRREHRAAAPAVRALLASKSKDVRAAAAQTAGELGDQEALPALRHALTQDTHHEVRGAALRAVCALLRRAGDAEGAARLALEHVAEGHVEDVRAAAKLLVEHPAPDALSTEAAGRLLGRLRDEVAPTLTLPEEDEPPAAFGARARSAVKNPLHAGRIVDVVAALAAQGVEARTRQAAHVLLSVGSMNVQADALAALRPCIAALDDEPWTAHLRALARARTTSAEALRWALRLLVAVDARAAAIEVVHELQAGNASRLRHGPGRREAVAILGLAQRGLAEPGAWAPWLRVALFESFHDVRRTARAGLQAGRFSSLMTVHEDTQVDA
jgi:large subunit ribosomal protein L7/L12